MNKRRMAAYYRRLLHANREAVINEITKWYKDAVYIKAHEHATTAFDKAVKYKRPSPDTPVTCTYTITTTMNDLFMICGGIIRAEKELAMLNQVFKD